MAQSKEFPQYKWSTPKSYTRGRKAGQPSVIFIHTTEGSEGRQSAEDGAAYDARRTDGTSTHFFVDQDTTVQEVLTTDEAHAARSHGNDVGIQIEVCGKAGQSVAQWADAASAGAIEQAAQLAVALRKKYDDRFPLVNLTPAQLRAGHSGFAEHKDATLAWPSDKGTHEDPGPNFPWAKLFARIKQLETPVAPSKPHSEEDDLIDPKTISDIAKAVWDYKLDNPYTAKGTPNDVQAAGTILRYVPSRAPHEETWRKIEALQAEIDVLKGTLPKPPQV
jgi:N-acetyl-anhydromuramyl-L-alanine amidase AmpD